jgi:hypothetical protein
MEGAQVLLEGALVLLLAATLFHALRLERALGVLKRDRAVLEDLVAGFNESTRAAEAGVERLRGATEGAGRQIARQLEQAQRLKDDLGFLTERGDRLAERLESGVRAARMAADQQAVAMASGMGSVAAPVPACGSGFGPGPVPVPAARPAMRRVEAAPEDGAAGADLPHAAAEPAQAPRLRSEAERDLLRALRAAR